MFQTMYSIIISMDGGKILESLNRPCISRCQYLGRKIDIVDAEEPDEEDPQSGGDLDGLINLMKKEMKQILITNKHL